MKLKFTLQRPSGPVDLVATVDSATTIGDLARHLMLADPRRHGTPPAGEVTLGLNNLGLDPRQPVGESGLRSGATVSLGLAGSTHADPALNTAAILRVLDGSDAGHEFPLVRGSSVIGRERGCEVRLTDTLVSRRHARINVSEVVEIIDLGSANGVQIDDLAVPRSILRADDVVQIGDTRFTVRLLPAAQASTAVAAGTAHVRSPRLDPVYAGEQFDAPELPERPGRARVPIVALFAPILMGGILYLITKNATSIAFVALSPVMMLGNAVESRIAGKSAYKKAVAEFHIEVDGLVEELRQAGGREVAARNAETPSVRECLDAALHRTPLLWTRRPSERGFADVRLGLGALPSRTATELPSAKKATRELLHELTAKIGPFTTVNPVPIVGELAESAVGVGGPRELALPVARSVVAQLAVLHSPAELVVTASVSSTAAAAWDWLKWLPHTSAATSPLSTRHLTSGATASAALVSELEDLLDRRTAKGDAREAAAPAIVTIVDGSLADHARLVNLAERGPHVGLYMVWLADEVTGLPAACKTFVELSRDGVSGTVGYVHTASAVTPVTLDTVTDSDVAALSRALSPIVDIGARAVDASDLPRSVSLLSVNGPELASSAEAVIERWAENRSLVTGPCAPSTPPKHAGSLRAVIGEAAGEKLALDLRADGPHALVGGTTGAGKSELLQAWILAMAAAHSPQRLTFLLVDYKGGSAFRDCVELPHTVGLVTDLSPHELRRALTSLSAELKYREHVLAQHQAKDLVTLEKQGVVGAPPSLVIVVDEFAALVSEVPEFVDGVVNVAQRGRSLGLHLILATQRPAGVIKDNLRANTNLRLALRMADEADSTDVLGATDAAFFDPALPGRAVSKTGPGRLVPFQTGYAGGWTSDKPPAPDILVEELNFGAALIWELPEDTDTVPVDPGPTDIRRLVASITAASKLAEIEAPRKPWLPDLGHAYDLADRERVPNKRIDTELVLGVRDDPDNQAQPTVAFYPDRDGNLAVYGTGGSGKSTLLRTLAISAGFTVHGGVSYVYGIDFGGRGLSMLEELPHVGSIISGSDHERVTRVLGMLRETIDDRALRYSKVNAATITDYRRLSGDTSEPRILLLIDGIAAFRQAYETADRQRWFDMFTSIAADGRPVGVHVVLSSDQRSGMTTALASAVQRRVVLRLASTDDYNMLGVQHDVLTAASPPGRGILDRAEVQIAVLGGDADVTVQAAAVIAFGAAMTRSGAAAAPPILRLPESVPIASLPTQVTGLPVLGLAGSNLEPFGYSPRGSFIVSGPSGSGRTTALRAIGESMRRFRPGVKLVLFGPRRTPLSADRLWDATAVGAQDVATAAAALVAELPGRVATGESVAIFVESVPDFTGGPADSALTELLKFCNAEAVPFVVEGETASMAGGIGLIGQVKAGRAGLALQPETADGVGVYRTNFPPRTNRSEFPPGRGLLVALGKTHVVQVALPSDPGGEGGLG